MQHPIVVGHYARIMRPGGSFQYIHPVDVIRDGKARLDREWYTFEELVPCCHPSNTKVGDIVQAVALCNHKIFDLDAEVLLVPEEHNLNLKVRMLKTGKEFSDTMFRFAHKFALYPELIPPKEEEKEEVPFSLSLFFGS